MEPKRKRLSSVETPKGEVKVVRVKAREILSDERKPIEFDSEVFETEPAHVRISHGVTKSIGDYESLRIDVSIEVPCYKERIEQTAKNLGERVAAIFKAEMDEYGIGLHG